MSTNKTPNYQLHSWLGTDDFIRSEINENFAAIDAILKEKKDIIFGTYIGDGNDAGQTIQLDAPIVALLVEDAMGTRTGYFSAPRHGGLIFAGVDTPLYCELGESSFRAWNNPSSSNISLGYLNQQDHRYLYIAWLA